MPLQVAKSQTLYMCGETDWHAAALLICRGPPRRPRPSRSPAGLDVSWGQATVGENASNLQVAKAQTLYMCGEAYKHAAALLVYEALRADPEHAGALLEYVRIVLDRGLVTDAMRILLRLLVNSRERTTVRQGSWSSSVAVKQESTREPCWSMSESSWTGAL